MTRTLFYTKYMNQARKLNDILYFWIQQLKSSCKLFGMSLLLVFQESNQKDEEIFPVNTWWFSLNPLHANFRFSCVSSDSRHTPSVPFSYTLFLLDPIFLLLSLYSCRHTIKADSMKSSIVNTALFARGPRFITWFLNVSNITMTRTKICINMSNGMVPFLLWYRRWMELRAVLLSR